MGKFCTQGGTAVASLVKVVQDKIGNTILPGFSRVKAFTGRLFDATSFARLAQSAERKALNLVVVGSGPMVGVFMWGCSLAGAGSGSIAPMKNWQLAQLRWPVHEEWLTVEWCRHQVVPGSIPGDPLQI